MKRRAFLAGLAAAIAIAGVSADARMHAPYRGHRIVPVAATVPPLDGLTQPAGAYSFRKVKSNYAGPAAKIRRTTGGTQDIGFTGTGDFDTTAATTFCAATTCFIDTWYDQSGNARDVVQATTTSQPALVFDCIGSLVCMRSAATATKLATVATITPVVPSTYSGVARRTVGTAQCNIVFNGNINTLSPSGSADTWMVFGSGTISGAAPDNTWHAGIGLINGASSVLRVDAVETAGSMGITPNVQPISTSQGGSSTTCDFTEAMTWNGYGLTPAERLALTNNQKNYWMPLPLDSFATPAAAYSLRKLKSSYAGPAVKLRRATGGTQDINFLGCTGFTGCPIDTVAAAAFCASTTCFIDTWYDQSGNARHATQATPANQPPLAFNCQAGLPCLLTTGTSQFLQSTVPAPSATQTLGMVAKRVSGTDLCQLVATASVNNNLISSTTGTWQLNSTGVINVPAAESAWHAAVGVLSGAASVLRVDGTEAAGTVTTGTGGGGTLYPVIANNAPCGFAEVTYWNGYALTLAERTALTDNQRNFWGF